MPDKVGVGDRIAGLWCLDPDAYASGGYDKSVLFRLFQNADDIKSTDDMLSLFAHGVFYDMAASLNGQRNEPRSDVFWHVWIARWLHDFVHVLYMRFLEVIEAQRLARSGATTILATSDLLNRPFDGLQDTYVNGFRDKRFNAILAADILRELNEELSTVRWTEIDPPYRPAPFQPAPPSKGLRGLLGRVVRASRAGRCDIGYPFGERSILQQGKMTAFRFTMHALLSLHQSTGTSPFRVPDRPTRPVQGLDERFQTIAPDIIRRYMPPRFADEVSSTAGTRDLKTKPGHCRVFMPSAYLSEQKRLRLANAADAGEKLVCVQHGGNYGMARAYSSGAESEYRNHAYITWGWRVHGDYDGQFIPLPMPGLSSWKNVHRERSARLLFVSGGQVFTFRRIQNTGNYFSEDTLENRMSFFDKLPQSVRKNAMFRPDLKILDSCDESARFQERHPDVPVCRDDFNYALSSSRLVVIDHPRTTMLFTLLGNIPTIGFWNSDSWAMAVQAEDLVKELRDAEVIFSSPHDAAAKITDVWNDVADWWSSPRVQNARLRFVEQQVLPSGQPVMSAWLRTLRAI